MNKLAETLDEAVKRIAEDYASGAALFFGDEGLVAEFVAHISPALLEMAEFVKEQIRNDPASTLYGIPMPEITKMVMERKAKGVTTRG